MLKKVRTRQERAGLYWLLGDLYLAEARALLQTGPDRREEARELLLKAEALARDRDFTRVLWKILFALSELTDGSEGENLAREAQEIVLRIAGGFEDPAQRKLFLGKPLVTSLVERFQRT
jgi:hypothetical protein